MRPGSRVAGLATGAEPESGVDRGSRRPRPRACPSRTGTYTQAGCLTGHAVRVRKVGLGFSWIAYRPKVNQAPPRAGRSTGGIGYWAARIYNTPRGAGPDLSLARAEAMVRWVLARPRLKPRPRDKSATLKPAGSVGGT